MHANRPVYLSPALRGEEYSPSMHSITLEVRDYELDAQGVVNNGVYFGYFEHARHRLLADRGVDFVALHRQGIDPVVVEAKIAYVRPLRSTERFRVLTDVTKHGALRYVFTQRIELADDAAECARAEITAVALKDGRPAKVPQLDALLSG